MDQFDLAEYYVNQFLIVWKDADEELEQVSENNRKYCSDININSVERSKKPVKECTIKFIEILSIKSVYSPTCKMYHIKYR